MLASLIIQNTCVCLKPTFVAAVHGLIVSVLPCLKAAVLLDSYVDTVLPVCLWNAI